MKIEMGREYRTRNGRAAEIFKIDEGIAYGRYKSAERMIGWSASEWDAADGQIMSGNRDFSLIAIPRTVKVDRWCSVNENGNLAFHHTEDDARKWARAYNLFGVLRIQAEVPELEAE